MKFGICAEIFANPSMSSNFAVVPKVLSSTCATQQGHIPRHSSCLLWPLKCAWRGSMPFWAATVTAASALLRFLFLLMCHTASPSTRSRMTS